MEQGRSPPSSIPHRGVDFNYPVGQTGINLTNPVLRAPVAGVVTSAEEKTQIDNDAPVQILSRRTYSPSQGSPLDTPAPIAASPALPQDRSPSTMPISNIGGGSTRAFRKQPRSTMVRRQRRSFLPTMQMFQAAFPAGWPRWRFPGIARDNYFPGGVSNVTTLLFPDRCSALPPFAWLRLLWI